MANILVQLYSYGWQLILTMVSDQYDGYGDIMIVALEHLHSIWSDCGTQLINIHFGLGI